MNLIQKKFLLTATVLSFLGLSVAYGVMLEMNQTQPVLMTTPESLPTIVIDAGHGGIDGGAVGVHKEIEKDINLAIATTLNTMLQAGGYPTVMVRNSDISIHDPQYTSVRQQKVSDIKNRLKLAEETPNAIYISIHQNQFEQSQYHGAQMFYSVNNPESQILGRRCVCSLKPCYNRKMRGRPSPLKRTYIYCTMRPVQPFWWNAAFCPTPMKPRCSPQRIISGRLRLPSTPDF